VRQCVEEKKKRKKKSQTAQEHNTKAKTGGPKTCFKNKTQIPPATTIGHLFSPRPHDLGDGQPAGLLPRAPQVERLGVAVLVALHVDLKAALEGVGAKDSVEHAHHRGALAVRDRVEHLLNLLCAFDWDLPIARKQLFE
jgi:hypothetical protein